MGSRGLITIGLFAMAFVAVTKAYNDHPFLQSLQNLEKRGRHCDDPGQYPCCCTCGESHTSCDYSNRVNICWCCHCPQKKCFPGQAKVRLDNGDVITIAQLQVGEILSTVNELGSVVPTEVLGFMKHETTSQGMYKHIITDTGNDITMSPDHLIIAAKHGDSQDLKPRYASEVEVGDTVEVTDGSSAVFLSTVVATKMDVMEGAYAPLTKEGTLFVDGVSTSCYAGFDHDLAHLFMTPMRWFPRMFNADNTKDGSRTYLDLVMQFGRWVTPEALQTKPNQAWHLMTNALTSDGSF